MDIFDDFLKMHREIEDHRKKLDEQYSMLRREPPKLLRVGDTVLVAAGLLGRGHPWIRKDCIVKEVSDLSVKVYRKESPSYEWEEWIDPVLIVDVIKRQD